jgi:hypothetical protein
MIRASEVFFGLKPVLPFLFVAPFAIAVAVKGKRMLIAGMALLIAAALVWGWVR